MVSVNQKKPKLEIIEVLRGVASLMVACFHIASTGYLLQQDPISLASSYGWTGVNIFFIISGFILPYSMYVSGYSLRNFFMFLKKRIVRIEPPYVISFLIIILLALTTSYYVEASKSIYSVLGHVAYLNAFTGKPWLNVVYWTLAIEFQFYLIIGLIYPLLIKSNPLLHTVLLISFLAINIIPVSKNLNIISSYLNFFLIGIILFQNHIEVINNKVTSIFLLAVLAFTFWYNGVILFFLAATAIFLIIYFKRRVIKNRLLLLLGTISYSLYLIHSPVGSIVSAVFMKISSDITFRRISVFLILIIVILFAFFYYRLVERYFKRLSSSIRYS